MFTLSDNTFFWICTWPKARSHSAHVLPPSPTSAAEAMSTLILGHLILNVDGEHTYALLEPSTYFAEGQIFGRFNTNGQSS